MKTEISIAIRITITEGVVFRELGNEIVQMSSTKQDELGHTLIFDRADELFTTSVQVRPTLGEFLVLRP